MSLYDTPIAKLDGNDDALGNQQGNVTLMVNVASKCGLTPQYKQLEAVYSKYKGKGFEVLGFPANQFGAQEPGTNEEIATFCTSKYNVDFPMFAKIVVKAEGWMLLNPQTPTFLDVAADNAFFKEIETAAARGVISGYDVPGGKEFRWTNNATRGQISKIVFNAITAP